MDERVDEWLGDKQNEALKVMPVSFLNAGFEVTVCDPTYAGYTLVPDLGIFDDYPEIHRYITNGNFSIEEFEMQDKDEATRNRNFFCYSVFRAAPLVFHAKLYDDGKYHETDVNLYSRQYSSGVSQATGIRRSFLSAYTVLKKLPEICDLRDENRNTFVMLSNDTTHEETMLQTPDYVPALTVDNTQYDKDHSVRRSILGDEIGLTTVKQMSHYHCNMAAMIQLGNWFDYLRENGVYDNTRIIIVADHGRDLGLFDMQFGDEDYADTMLYNPLLLVKDFDSRELTVDDRFMTNADTPVLAMKDLIADPVNPFTGVEITDAAKDAPQQYVAFTNVWNTKKNNGNTFKYITWLSVGHDVFDMKAWKVLDGSPAGD